MPTPPMTDEQCREAWALYVEHEHRCKPAAEAAGVPYNTMSSRIKKARERGLHLSEGAQRVVKSAGLSGTEARGGWIHDYDQEGKKIGTTRWAVEPDHLDDGKLERIACRMQRIIPVPTIQRPKDTDSDKLNFIPLFDVHLGMRVGSFGTAEAVSRLKEGFQYVLESAPMAETTIILNGGDFTEANDNSALTPQSKHPLAVDMEYDDLADIAVDVTIEMIELALTRSDRVVYQALRANHDPATSIAIRQGLRQRYRDNPRFHMPDGFGIFTHEWEGNLLAAIHGDQKNTKPEMLTLAIAARHAAAWGTAKRRELWRGHNHKEVVVSVPGMRVQQVNPICPPGRYANDNLFTGESDIQSVTYRKGGGRCATAVHIFEDL